MLHCSISGALAVALALAVGATAGACGKLSDQAPPQSASAPQPTTPVTTVEEPANQDRGGEGYGEESAKADEAPPMDAPAPPPVAATGAAPALHRDVARGPSGSADAAAVSLGELRARATGGVKLVDVAPAELELGLMGGGDGTGAAADTTVAEPVIKLDEIAVEGRALDDGEDVAGKDARADADDEEQRQAKEKKREESEGTASLDAGKRRVEIAQDQPDALTYLRPERVLPRMFYFENTYLGGSAAYRERLLRLDAALREGERPYRLAFGSPQPFDPPTTSGLEVTAEVDAPFFDQPRRVFLQVGLRGSPRYGWRRPPLDVVLVIDGPALTQAPDAVTEMVVQLLGKLGPADRLGIVVAGEQPAVFTELSRLERARGRLAATLDTLPAAAPRRYDPAALGRAMDRAGEILADASADTAIVPGTETVLVVTAGDDAARVASATAAAHALTLQGAVTSVFALDRTTERGGWWQVANAGHGNYHHLGDATTGELVGWELESLARVVARLVRVNIRLGKTASAIRVLGTRILDEQEVAQVKAREEATDKNLSRSMGITSDRGEDDDGIQTVIPYFYGDDSHVILVELWVDGPGPIADVTVKYKDMVNLGNATARTSVRLDTLPRAETPEAELIARNVAGFELAEALQRASHRVLHNDPVGAAQQLSVARAKATLTDGQDTRVIDGFSQLVGEQSWTWDTDRRAAVSASLQMAGERRVGETAP